MNALTLAVASIKSRPLHSSLCTAAVAAGIALLCAVFLFSQSVAAGFARNAQGVDIVVGTKGSPLQMVLSSVYHADIPAGNITMADYEELKRSRQVRQAIPLALGDSYKGFRMVGATPAYLDLYKAEFKNGGVFSKPFETVAGAHTGLAVGQEIAVTHGFAANSDDVHDAHLYKITGVLKPTGTVLDKLLVTQVASVQQLHAGHSHYDHAEEDEEKEPEEHNHHSHDDEHSHDHHEDHQHDSHDHETHDHEAHEHDEPAHDESEHEGHDHEDRHESDDDLAGQVTAVLIKVRSPVDLMNLPRKINESSNVMAAVPSYEMARFTKSLGIGKQLVIVLGIGFVILAALMLLASLASGLSLRRYDLAVLRVLGAAPARLFATVMAEAAMISGAGAIIGVIAGHLIAYSAVISIESLRGLVLPGTLLAPNVTDIWFILLGVGTGLFAAFVPSLAAARTDIAGLLAKGRS